LLGENVNTTKKCVQILLQISKEIVPEVNTDNVNYMTYQKIKSVAET